MNRHEDDLEFLSQVSTRLQNYLAEILKGNGRVKPLDDPSTLRRIFLPFSNELQQKSAQTPGVKKERGGLSKEDAHTLTDLILKHSTPALHPHFWNQLYGGFQAGSVAGEWLSTVLNMSMATFEISPVASTLEAIVFERTRELVGYPPAKDSFQAGGTLVPGGSNGNMVALLVARNRMFPETKSKGLSALGAKPLCFFISEEAHYSFEKAANVLGIGTDHVIAVAADSQGRMSPLALEREIEASKQMGLIPFFVGATSGTTVKAAFDPLLEISRVCKKHQVWLHVDAALGGSLLFSQKNRHMLEGIECADSVVWDAHKLMNVPLVASILLFKNTEDLLFSNSGGGEQYLFHEASSSMQSNESSNSRYDSGVASLQCGRRGDVFKIFYAWFMKGEKAWEEQIDAHIARTFRFESRLLQDSRFELISPAQSLSLCFRVKLASSQHEKAAPLDDQLYLRKQVLNAGKYMVNYSVDESNRPFFRLVALNNLVNDSDYENFFNHLLELAGYNEPLFEGKNLPI